MHIDDSLDVFPVHGVGGALGTILAGVFIAEQFGGAGLSEGMTLVSQVWVQIQGVFWVLVWTVAATFIILKVVNVLVGLRVDEQHETEGLDVTQHEETGYNM